MKTISDWTYLYNWVQFPGSNSRLSLSETVAEHGIKDILFIHGKRTIPVQCAPLFLERFSHSQSKHRWVLKVLVFPPIEVLNQRELQKGGSLDEVRLVVQWCEWMTVYGERAAANQSIRLICSPFLRESARKHIVSMTTRGWTIKKHHIGGSPHLRSLNFYQVFIEMTV